MSAELTITATVVGLSVRCAVASPDRTVRKATVWMFPPGIHAGFDVGAFDPSAFETQTWLDIKNERLDWVRTVRPPAAFRKAITSAMRKHPGAYTAVAVAGERVAAATFEVA